MGAGFPGSCWRSVRSGPQSVTEWLAGTGHCLEDVREERQLQSWLHWHGAPTGMVQVLAAAANRKEAAGNS